MDRFERRIRGIRRRAMGVGPVYAGLAHLFQLLRDPKVLVSLTRWVRVRLRAALRRQWKTRVAAGPPYERRRGSRDPSRVAAAAPGISPGPTPFLRGSINAYFRPLGLPPLAEGC